MRPVLTLALAAAAVAADPAPSASAPLTLGQALRLAAERNEDPLIAAERLRAAAAAQRQVTARLLPQLIANGRTSRSGNDDSSDKVDRIAGSVGVTMTLVDLETWADRRAAQERTSAQRHRGDDTRRALAFDAADAFHARLAADALVTAAERRVAVARQIVERARARFAAGLDDRQSVTRAELDLATAEQSLTARRNDVLTSGLALAAILAEPPESADRALVEPVAATIPAAALNDLVLRARSRRPDLLALERDVAAARASARGPRAEWVPVLSAGASANSSFTDPPGENDQGWTAYLQADWTLYDGGGRYARAEQRDAEQRIAELTLAKAERQIATAIRTAQADLDTAEAAVRQGEARLRLARQNADEVKAKADAGLTTPIDAADALAELFQAEADLATRTFARARAALRLREALGEWPEDSP
jgi:outer membrane protein TolC